MWQYIIFHLSGCGSLHQKGIWSQARTNVVSSSFVCLRYLHAFLSMDKCCSQTRFLLDIPTWHHVTAGMSLWAGTLAATWHTKPNISFTFTWGRLQFYYSKVDSTAKRWQIFKDDPFCCYYTTVCAEALSTRLHLSFSDRRRQRWFYIDLCVYVIGPTDERLCLLLSHSRLRCNTRQSNKETFY